MVLKHSSKVHYANAVIKTKKVYELWYDMIAVVMGIANIEYNGSTF